MGHATACGPMRCGVAIHCILRNLGHAHPGAMTKPTKKCSQSEVVSEVKLRRAALAYAAVANLGLSDPRWRRCWRALRLAAIGMAAEIREAAGLPEGHPPSRALAVRRSPPTLQRLRRQAAL